jgi:hypothetical protein
MKRAQNIAAGKERQKRKGLHNFDDEDDFDDDYQKREHREKKQRIEGLVMEGLRELPLLPEFSYSSSQKLTALLHPVSVQR